MKIVYDHQAFTMQSQGGISRYFTNLAKEIYKLKNQVTIYAPIHRNCNLAKISADLSKIKSY